MQITLERLSDRLPPSTRGRTARRIAAAVTAVLLVVAVAVSCGGGASGTSDVPVRSDGMDAGVTGVRSPSDEAGGTLRVVTAEVDSLDPQRSYSPGTWNLMRLYARTLVTYSSSPGSTGALVPDLAVDMGSTPDGGKTWTFTLRENIRFETGQPITSKDVKYGIERTFASEVIRGGPSYLVDMLDDPDARYPGPYSDDESAPPLASIKTPDDRTIVFELRSVQPDFPYVLALPSSSPVPQAQDTGATYGKDPVSSGPYVVAAVDEEVGILLTRNPEWDPVTDEVRTALPDQVLVRTGLTGIERDQALLAGSADIDISGSGVQTVTTARLEPGATGDEGEVDEELLGRVDDVTTGALRMLALPTSVPPMDKGPCRAAVAEAVDRWAVQEVLGGPGKAVRTSQLWPRDFPGGPEDPDPGPDLDAARAALKECGHADGFSTTLAVSDIPSSVDVARAVSAQLAEVGITAKVKPLDRETFYGDEIGSPSRVKENWYGIVLATWAADYPTPGSFLVPLVDSASIQPAANTNFAELEWEVIDQLVGKALAVPEAAAAERAWREVAVQAAAVRTYVPLAETRLQLVAGQRLRNGVVMRPYNGYDLATAGVR